MWFAEDTKHRWIRIQMLRVTCALSLTLWILVFYRLVYMPSNSLWKDYYRWQYYVYFPVSLLTFVHHASTITKWLYFYGVIDFLLVCAEMTGLAFSLVFFNLSWYSKSQVSNAQFSSVPDGLIFVCAVATACAVLAQLLDRIIMSAREGGKYLLAPLNLFPATGKPRNALGRLLGHSLVGEQIAGETLRVIVPRFFIAYCFLVLVVAYFIFASSVEPAEDTRVTSTVQSTITVDYLRELVTDDFIYWRVMVGSNARFNGTEHDACFPNMSVVPHFEGHRTPTEGSTTCEFHSELDHQVCVFTCPLFRKPQETVLAKRYEVHGWESLDNIISAYEFPDLVVTVDFGSTPSDVNTGDPTTFMYVYPSFTNDDPKDVLLRSTPFAVSKGVNLALPLQLEVREVFGSDAAATFGLFPGKRRFLTSKAHTVYPDPSTTVARGENITTIRLSPTDKLGFQKRGWVLTREIKDNTVLSGLASAGGFWTFMNGLFAFICGRTLLGVIAGIKPLSSFGLIHLFQKDDIREGCESRYPGISEDLRQNRGGLLDLVMDHLVDLEVLRARDRRKATQDRFDMVVEPLDDQEVVEHQQRRQKQQSPKSSSADKV